MTDTQEERHFALAEPWLIRTVHLSHAQFRILCYLLAHIGGRRAAWHMTYAEIAKGAATNEQTVLDALQYFSEQGWITVSGNRQWRKYRIHKEAIEKALWTADPDEEEED